MSIIFESRLNFLRQCTVGLQGVLFLVSKLLSARGFRTSGMWILVAWLVDVDILKYRGAFKTSGTTNRSTTLWNKVTNISNLEFYSSIVKTQTSTQCVEERNICDSPVLLTHLLRQHELTTSFANEASAGDNKHRFQTFPGDLPLTATYTKCVQLLQTDRIWAGRSTVLSGTRTRETWFTCESAAWLTGPPSEAACCQVDHWQSNA
jgi:hypothetical protein